MTVLVGVFCKDGVVVGADSAATFTAGQIRTIEQSTKKIEIVADQIIVAGTGQVGLGQRFNAIVESGWRNKLFTKAPVEVGKALAAEAIKDFSFTSATKGQYGALVAFPSQHRPVLCEFAPTDFQPEQKTENLWYVSMGSGQSIADPFLGFIRAVFWKDGRPTCQEAIFAVTWTLSQAIKLNPGGINGPLQIAILVTEGGKSSARLLEQAEIAEHEGNVAGAEAHLQKYRDILRGKNTAEIADVPQPPAAAA